MVLKKDGSVWAAGSNDSGQLGDGTTKDRSTAVAMESVGVGNLQVAAGNHHTLILRGDGAVYAVGRNSDGQLGDGALGRARRAAHDEEAARGARAAQGGRRRRGPCRGAASSRRERRFCKTAGTPRGAPSKVGYTANSEIP